MSKKQLHTFTYDKVYYTDCVHHSINVKLLLGCGHHCIVKNMTRNKPKSMKLTEYLNFGKLKASHVF